MDFEQFLRKEKSLFRDSQRAKCHLQWNVSSIKKEIFLLFDMGVKCDLSH